MTNKQPKTNDADICSNNNPFGLNQNISIGLGPSGKDKL
jgi:hypothetical protein